MVQTGTVLNGRYEIVRLIAEGGMGAVYEGRDLKFGGGPVAIKRCLMTGEAMQRAFIREAELLANLSHPGVAKARDMFAEPDGQYLVMEYIPGSDLEQVLNERGRPIALETALEWADQVLDALSYMHGRRPPVIHRDIKPSNLKLTPSGHIMLIDFGLAKGNGTTSLAGYSVNYAPLEQLQGEGTDPRSDLYALGATLYRLLTGRAPESALDRVKLLAKHHRDPLLSVHVINPQIPESVARVIQNAMAIEIEDRLPSAIDMRDRLRHAGGFLALNYQMASAPTQYDQFTEKLPDMGSVLANGRSTFPYAGNVPSTTPSLNRSTPPVSTLPGAFRSQPVVEAGQSVRSTVVDTVAEPVVAASGPAGRGRSAGKYLVATCCLVSLLFLGVAGNGYRNWRIAKAKEQQQQTEQLASSLQASPSPEPQNHVAPAVSDQNAADATSEIEIERSKREAAVREAELQRQVAAAAREANRLKQEAAAREAQREKQEAAMREAERHRQEAAMREAERQKQELAARELDKQKAAWEAEKLRQQLMAREAERQKHEASARELEKQKAAWEAERQKAARESEKQLAALEAERQKAAREAEKQRQESAARAAAYAKQQEKVDAANRKAEKEAKEMKEAKKQKKREEEKKEAHTGVRVGVSILGGIIGRRRY